jgi:enoyl-CoA hydratase/carnithine racemase
VGSVRSAAGALRAAVQAPGPVLVVGADLDAAGAYLLTRLIGPQRAKELIFFADDLPAAEAARLGLVNRVVPATSWPRPRQSGRRGWRPARRSR